jgi:uncharacterized protein (DUF2147 family)
MNKKRTLFVALALIIGFNTYSQTIFGKWKTIDDETGNEKSIVEIYKAENGKAYAKILQLLEEGKEDSVCDNCDGAKKDQPIKGMEIIDGLTKDDDEWDSGKILDPKTGKVYKCILELEETDKLKVRGYIGFSLIGRTQYWYRLK